MRIPETLKIQGFDWKIASSSEITDAAKAYGLLDIKRQTIYLDCDFSEQKRDQTLLHELLHACFYHSGLWQRIEEGKNISEEEIVQAVSMVLYQVLKENALHFDE